MSEKELGRALLEMDSQKVLSGVPDARQATWRVLERDRRRIWWQTALTIALWIGALFMVLWMLVALALLMPLEAHLRDEAQVARAGMTPAMRAEAEDSAHIMSRMIILGITCSVGILALAAGSTVLLVLATRRATLRQINASLLEISEQLKALRQAPAPPAS